MQRPTWLNPPALTSASQASYVLGYGVASCDLGERQDLTAGSVHIERGFAPGTGTVTIVGAESPHDINDHESETGEGILSMVAGTVGITGHNNSYYRSEPLIAFGPEHARTIANDGYSKADVKRYSFKHATVPLGKFSRRNYERRFLKTFPAATTTPPRIPRCPPCQSADDVIVIVLGGAGKHSMYLATFGETRSVTRGLMLSDGREARSVEEFRGVR